MINKNTALFDFKVNSFTSKISPVFFVLTRLSRTYSVMSRKETEAGQIYTQPANLAKVLGEVRSEVRGIYLQ